MKDQYLTYSIEELATDDSFIRWVQAGQPLESDWGAWLDTHPAMQDQVQQAAEIVSTIRFQEQSDLSSKTDAIWARINQTLEEETTEAKVVQMPRRQLFKVIGYAAAACLALLLVFQLVLNSNDDLYVGQAESLAHVLPDNSKVTINADSKISYDKEQWEDDRTLSLEGEAYFEVEKGERFTVNTPQGAITVLGTSFNIYSREDGFRVHCTTGRVEVASNNQKVILTPGTQSRLNETGQLIKENLSADQPVDWLDKIYRFNRIPLKVVFASIERQFAVDIIVDPAIGERLYTGVYESTDLDKALNVICFPMELTPVKNGKRIRIISDAGN